MQRQWIPSLAVFFMFSFKIKFPDKLIYKFRRYISTNENSGRYGFTCSYIKYASENKTSGSLITK